MKLIVLKQGITWKEFFLLFLIMICLINPHITPGRDRLSFGSIVLPQKSFDIKKNPLVIPTRGETTALLFFNINHPTHQKIASSLNFLYETFKNKPGKINFIGISRGDLKHFINFSRQYNITYSLVNDENQNLTAYFDYRCGSCTKIIIIDKFQKLRYEGPFNDQYIIETVIQRYLEEK